MARWFLDGFFDAGNSPRRVVIQSTPFRVGRAEGLELTIDSKDVSRQHAEFFEEDGVLLLRDLGSTNGTFVNHQRLTAAVPLADGDVIHFAHLEARFNDQQSPQEDDGSRTMLMHGELSDRIPLGAREFREMISQRLLQVEFQPIVDNRNQLAAYEVLGRGHHPGLPPAPGPLFRIAESVDLAVELSEAFRMLGMEVAHEQGLELPVLMNIHPLEMGDTERLISQLHGARQRFPDLKLILEIHEQAVTDLQQMRELAAQLKQLRIGVAYDDFGAGQARLLELTEAPPEIVKFDIALIQDVDQANSQRQDMLRALVAMLHAMGVRALAEGVATEAEARTCRQMGFDLFQGFFLGRPKAITH